MKFSIFQTVKTTGSLCTPQNFQAAMESKTTLKAIQNIAQMVEAKKTESDPAKIKEWEEKIGEEKKKLPVITWQAHFPKGRRNNKNAEPSGLYMLDIDHVEEPQKLMDHILELCDACDIVYIGKTPSLHGVRVVAECRPELHSIAECQKWLCQQLGIAEYDEVCKDWARSSFIVPSDYIFYIDNGIFEREPKCVYSVSDEVHGMKAQEAPVLPAAIPDDVQTEYEGIAIDKICKMWLKQNGGEPSVGGRNTKLYTLALRLRYICDFNDMVMLKNMPRYGLSESEMLSLIHSANTSSRGQNIPSDMSIVINQLKTLKNMGEDESLDQLDDDEYTDLTDISVIPELPPIFKQWFDVAPSDFKKPTIGCLLPVLGALGSKLRAEYFDGTMQSPSFMVSLEAPQASGKSFMRRIADYCLAQMKEHDEQQRAIEKAYNDKRAELKVLNIKVTQKNKDEVLGSKPQVMIRYLPPTISITKFLMRMDEAQGLHCFALAEEIDTVYKAYKKAFSSLSDIMRCAFDNVQYGQDYASDASFSGLVNLYYNTLFSGTPRAMRRFYPDIEDGLVSRVFFISLPRQFGKPYVKWKDFSAQQKSDVDIALVRLNEISLQGDTVQPEHVMNMKWLGNAMFKWCLTQQQLAVRMDDIARDTFCRRSAVVGFRAGMLAYFLWNEQKSSQRKVIAFAKWIANMMLNQHLIRFEIEEEVNNTTPYKNAFVLLPNTFTHDDVTSVCAKVGIQSNSHAIVYKWKIAGLIKKTRDDNKKIHFIKIDQEVENDTKKN